MPRPHVRPTRYLDQADRERMEDCFGERFATVRLVRVPHLRPCLGRLLGSSMGEDVHVAEGLPPNACRAVLAHELAHVVQRRNLRRGVRRASSAPLEAEAHAAAAAMAAGHRFTCRLADSAARARPWAEAGHYYTVYFIMLAAGADPVNAAQIAFFSQMPDQVSEFDAMKRSEGFGATVLVGGPIWAAVHTKELASDIEIERGLHCLNGAGAEPETVRRRQIILKAGNPLEFGLGIHAFGDSYAHRTIDNPNVLYVAPVGHAFDLTAPDHIDNRPSLYQQYGLDLYDVVCAREPGKARRLDRAAVAAHLKHFSNISSAANEGLQIFEIRRSTIGDLSPPGNPATMIMMNGYKPEAEHTSAWSVFKDRDACYAAGGLGPQVLADTLRYAMRWSTTGA